MEELLNKRVVHESLYGEGTITKCENRNDKNLDYLITVLFDSFKKKMRFTYPGSFNGVLRFLSHDDQIKAEEMKRREDNNREQERIKKIIKDRGIHSLLHVSQLSNLESILLNGIIPVDYLQDIEASINDKERKEGCRDCSSFSIGRMNKYYFGNKNRNNDYSLSFICVRVDPFILADDNKKFFCPSNAASYNVSSRIKRGELTTSNDFQHMFDKSIKAPTMNRDGYWTREPDWPDYWPTDWQAEVLYQGVVYPQHILKVEFKSDEDYKNSREILEKHGVEGSVNYSLNFW